MKIKKKSQKNGSNIYQNVKSRIKQISSSKI
jgi:hypothetical protein